MPEAPVHLRSANYGSGLLKLQVLWSPLERRGHFGTTDYEDYTRIIGSSWVLGSGISGESPTLVQGACRWCRMMGTISTSKEFHKGRGLDCVSVPRYLLRAEFAGANLLR